MNQDLNILQLVLHASFVVQIVMALLMLVSLASWSAIFRKLFALKRVKAHNETFEKEFWSGASLNELFASASSKAQNSGPMERIFASGMTICTTKLACSTSWRMFRSWFMVKAQGVFSKNGGAA